MNVADDCKVVFYVDSDPRHVVVEGLRLSQLEDEAGEFPVHRLHKLTDGFLCYRCVDLLNAMNTAHDEHHFPPFFICCKLRAPPFARQHQHEHSKGIPVFQIGLCHSKSFEKAEIVTIIRTSWKASTYLTIGCSRIA